MSAARRGRPRSEQLSTPDATDGGRAFDADPDRLIEKWGDLALLALGGHDLRWTDLARLGLDGPDLQARRRELKDHCRALIDEAQRPIPAHARRRARRRFDTDSLWQICSCC